MTNNILKDEKFKPPSSVSDQAELFRFAIMYNHQKPLEKISTNVKGSYSSISEEIGNFMYPVYEGGENVIDGFFQTLYFPFRLMILIREEIIKQSSTPNDSKGVLSFVGLCASLLLSHLSAMIGGLLMIASTPFIAVARLVEICFPGTFGVKVSDTLSSESGSSSEDASSFEDADEISVESNEHEKRTVSSEDVNIRQGNLVIEKTAKFSVLSLGLFSQLPDNAVAVDATNTSLQSNTI